MTLNSWSIASICEASNSKYSPLTRLLFTVFCTADNFSKLAAYIRCQSNINSKLQRFQTNHILMHVEPGKSSFPVHSHSPLQAQFPFQLCKGRFNLVNIFFNVVSSICLVLISSFFFLRSIIPLLRLFIIVTFRYLRICDVQLFLQEFNKLFSNFLSSTRSYDNILRQPCLAKL